MLLANSVVIFEAAEPLAWKRALEPNSWPFGDLWSAFPEFANSIIERAGLYVKAGMQDAPPAFP
jgi:hypothetical protein